MKKLISLILALVMVMGLATTAFAEEAGSKTLNKENGTSYDIKVEGKYIEQLKSDEIISVDVEWGAMNFTYAASFQGTWNPGDHSYTKDTEHEETGDWVDDSADIKVTNHSNVDVTANFSFKADVTTVTGSFAESTASGAIFADEEDKADFVTNPENKSLSVDLKAGEVDGYATADNKTVTFTIGGSLADTYTTNTKLGTITVSVEKKAASSGSEDNTEDGEKTVTRLMDAVKYSQLNAQPNYTTSFSYNHFDGHDADWSTVNLVAIYSDGSTETVAASDASVTITYSGKSLAQMKTDDETGSCSCTLTYKGCSFTVSVSVMDYDPTNALPFGAGYGL